MDSYIYDPERAERINSDALSLLLEMLQGYENQITPKHEAVLYALIRGFTDIYFNRLTGDYVAPLFTGGGKTTAIIAWLAALSKHREKDHIPVIVATSHVEALCNLKRSLIKRGIIAEDIYLKHSKKKASLPSNEGEPEANTFVILMTHTKLIPRYNNQLFLKGNEHKRQLIIYDESYFKSELLALTKKELNKKLPKKRFSENQGFAYTYGGAIKAYLSHLQSTKDTYIKGVKYKRKKYEAFNPFAHKLEELSKKDLRICRDKNGGVIQGIYSKHIPNINLISLDASYPVRKLLHIDTNLQNLFDKTGYESSYRDAKDYSELELNIINHKTTLAALKEEVDEQNLDKPIIKELKHLINLIPLDEAILIFTLKKIQPHIEALLKAETKLTLPDGKQRINFITWGKETSLNDFAHCKNVILVGILIKPNHTYGGEYLAQLGDIKKQTSFSIEENIRQSERLHLIYQALSRGSSRKTANGFAEPMKAFILHDKPIAGLELVFPNALYQKFEPLAYHHDKIIYSKPLLQKPQLPELLMQESLPQEKPKQEDKRIAFDKELMLSEDDLKKAYKAFPDLIEKLQEGRARKGKQSEIDSHVSCLVANLLKADSLDKPLQFSFNEKKWVVKDMYNPEKLSLTIMKPLVNILIEEGIINRTPSFYNRDKKKKDKSKETRLIPTHALQSALAKVTNEAITPIIHPDKKLLILKYSKTERKKRKLNKRKPYKVDSRFAKKTTKELQEYNQLLYKQDIRLDGVPIFLPNRDVVTRTFNGNFKRSGRFYNAAWHNMRSEDRPRITINQQPVVELDFKAIHINLLYHLKGLNYTQLFENNDPYYLAHYEDKLNNTLFRNIAKNLMLKAVNAKSRKGAIGACRTGKKPISPEDQQALKELRVTLEDVMDRIVTKHYRIEEMLFSSKMGFRLQSLDSSIAADVKSKLVSQSIPVLSVHDSFIVTDENEDLLRSIMNETYIDVVGKQPEIKKHGLDTILPPPIKAARKKNTPPI